MLCSDGLCGLCRDEEINETMNNFCEDIEVCKRELINSALNAGGYDNVTIALMEVVDDDSADIADTCDFSTKKTKKRKKNKKEGSASLWKILIFMIILLVIIALVMKNTELFDGGIRETITNAIF